MQDLISERDATVSRLQSEVKVAFTAAEHCNRLTADIKVRLRLLQPGWLENIKLGWTIRCQGFTLAGRIATVRACNAP